MPRRVDTTLVAHLDAEKDAGNAKVALIDINMVFEKHEKFQQRFKELGERFKELEATAKTEQAELKRMQDEFAKKEGSAQTEEEKARIEKRESDLIQTLELEQKSLAEGEALIYFETYQEIEANCKAIAEEKAISLILKVMHAEMKASDPNSVRLGLARAVVYHKESLDITDEIIAAVNHAVSPDPKAGLSKPGAALFAARDH